APAPRYQDPVLQSYGLSPHLREAGRRPLRGEGQRRVGVRSSRQDLEAVRPRPGISRLRSLQVQRATRSPLLCRRPTGDLASESGGCRRSVGASVMSNLPHGAGDTLTRIQSSARLAALLAALNRGDHSITSSARARSVGGTSRPSALAVLRLMTSSYLVGACTGRS